MKTNKRGFTLIELLVVIAIIGILATIAVVALQQARQSARDSKRIADIKQIQTALELYYNYNSEYPTNISNQISDGTTVYMEIVPTAPTPADGDCSSEENLYIYEVVGEGVSYNLSFCLGGQTGGLSPGLKKATPSGVVSLSEPLSPPPASLSCINLNPGFEGGFSLGELSHWYLMGLSVDPEEGFLPSLDHNPIISGDAHEGSHAVQFKGEDRFLSVIMGGAILENEASYELEFYSKGNGVIFFAYGDLENDYFWNFADGTWDSDVANPFETNGGGFLYLNPVSVDSLSDYSEYTVNPVIGEGDPVGIVIFSMDDGEPLIDSLSMKKDGLGENILSNPSFEDWEEVPEYWVFDVYTANGEVLEVEDDPSNVYEGSYSIKIGKGPSDSVSILLSDIIAGVTDLLT
jgi:prepilin-type N-terminal cleavage/methylation domain-containing protein